MPALGHVPGTMVNKLEATCTADGYTDYICGRCQTQFRTAYVDAFGHDFSGPIEEVYLDEETTDAKNRINDDIQVVNQRLPQIRNIGKVVVRDTDFVRTPAMKIARNLNGNVKK